MMSRKPAAKRFRKWVTAEVLPAIRRDGHYALPGSDRAELGAKRAYYDTLPEAHRARAEARAALVAEVERLISEGWRVGAAIAEVAAANGIGVRTLYSARRATYMVGRSDRAAALAPRWSGRRGMIAACHPQALAQFMRLVRAGVRVSPAYRQTVQISAAEGWEPTPCERTMRRAMQDAGARGLIQIGNAA